MSDEEIRTEERPGGGDRVLATVLFTDIVGATERVAALGDDGWRDLLRKHHIAVRRELGRFRGREVDTAGDGFFAVFEEPAWAIRCAHAIASSVERLGLQVRVGLHTGECSVTNEKVVGLAVHIGARVVEQAGPGEVILTGTLRDLVAGSGFRFEERGEHTLKGVPGGWRLHSLDRATVQAPARVRNQGYLECLLGGFSGAALLGAAGAGVGLLLSHPWTDIASRELSSFAFVAPAMKTGMASGAVIGCLAALRLRGLPGERETAVNVGVLCAASASFIPAKVWRDIGALGLAVVASAPLGRLLHIFEARRQRPALHQHWLVRLMRRGDRVAVSLALLVALVLGALGVRSVLTGEGLQALGFARDSRGGWTLALAGRPIAVIAVGEHGAAPSRLTKPDQRLFAGRASNRRWAMAAALTENGLCMQALDVVTALSGSRLCGFVVPAAALVQWGTIEVPGGTGTYAVGMAAKGVRHVRLESADHAWKTVTDPYPSAVTYYLGRPPGVLVEWRTPVVRGKDGDYSYADGELFPVNYFIVALPRGVAPRSVVALDEGFEPIPIFDEMQGLCPPPCAPYLVPAIRR